MRGTRPASPPPVPNDLRAFWMPFTANRQFKKAPRMFVAAKDMHYTTADGRQVLDGTAGRYAEIEIDLFPESAKEVEIYFLNENVAYEHRKPRHPGANPPETVLSFDWDDIPVRLAIYPDGQQRVARKAHERARTAQVEALIAADGRNMEEKE